MKHDEFIGHVQDRAKLGSRGEAEQVTRAVLETLSERLKGGEASNLASQLPEEIGLHLTRDQKAAAEAERFSLNDFYQRVSDRERADLPDAVHHARATMSVVDEAVSSGEMSDVRSQLGPDYAELFSYQTSGS